MNPGDQRWGFWPLLPLYPYGRRRTLFSGTKKPPGPWISTSSRNLQEIEASQIANTINAKLSLNGGSVQNISIPQMGEKACSPTNGSLGVAVYRRQMQQARCLFLFFHLGELCKQIPGVLRRHFPILLPFDARQFGRRHRGKTCQFNLTNVVSMWPLKPSVVTQDNRNMVYPDTTSCDEAIKKPQPCGLKPGNGEQTKHTGPASTIKGFRHHIWWPPKPCPGS